jgi:hypothetical protein
MAHPRSRNFSLAICRWLERCGYRGSPLEVIAYDLQDRFDTGCKPFDVEAEVGRRLSAMK